MKIPLTIPFWLWDKIISRWWFWLVIVAICNTVVIVKIYKQLVVLDREVWSGGLYCCDEQDETKPCEGPLALRLAMLEQRVARIGNFVHLPDEQPQASEPATISTATPQGQDCTVELALQAEPDKKYLEENKKRSAETLTYFQKIHQVIDSLPVPSELPKLPDIAVHVADWNQPAAVKDEKGKCILGPTKTLVTESHGGGSWRSVLAFWAGSFDQHAQETGDENYYETQVGLSELDEQVYLAWPLSGYSEFTTGSLEGIRKVVLQVIEDEEDLQTLAQWAVPSLPTLLTGSQNQARQWLRDFWPASQANFTNLQAAVAQYDKETKSGDKYRETYYYQHSNKREGMFLRRWINKGGGKAGDDYILVLRFWMVRVAEVFDMPETKTWANQIQSKIRGATTLKFTQFYIDELKRIRGVE